MKHNTPLPTVGLAGVVLLNAAEGFGLDEHATDHSRFRYEIDEQEFPDSPRAATDVTAVRRALMLGDSRMVNSDRNP